MQARAKPRSICSMPPAEQRSWTELNATGLIFYVQMVTKSKQGAECATRKPTAHARGFLACNVDHVCDVAMVPLVPLQLTQSLRGVLTHQSGNLIWKGTERARCLDDATLTGSEPEGSEVSRGKPHRTGCCLRTLERC